MSGLYDFLTKVRGSIEKGYLSEKQGNQVVNLVKSSRVKEAINAFTRMKNKNIRKKKFKCLPVA